jgi:hypothetical protein
VTGDNNNYSTQKYAPSNDEFFRRSE